VIKRVDTPKDAAAIPGEGGLARWSRLKQESRTEEKKQDAPPPAVQPAPETETRKKTDDVLKDLPSLESLTKDSDYSLFMRDGVPDDLRAKALQKLWASDPAFREPFPFEMHMEDYNKTFVAIDAAKDTIYRAVGGYLTGEKDEKKGMQSVSEQSAARGESENPVSENPEKNDGNISDASDASVDNPEKSS